MKRAAPIEPEGLFDGLRAAPIFLGALIDNLATVLVYGLLVAWMAPSGAAESSAATARALEELFRSPAFLGAMLAAGALCTVLGAYLGARLAGRLHVRHGGWIAVVSTLLSLLLLLPQPDPAAPQPDIDYPFWLEVSSWLLIIPSGVLGGWLASLSAGPQED